jgi:hypothetical protein
MVGNWLLAYKFMRGTPLKTRLVFACFFAFKEKYRVMPLGKHEATIRETIFI